MYILGIPVWAKLDRNLITFEKDSKKGKHLRPELSFFYSVGYFFCTQESCATHQKKAKSISVGHKLFKKCYSQMNLNNFAGIQATDWLEIDRIETILEHKVLIYQCTPDGEEKYYLRHPEEYWPECGFDSEPIVLLNVCGFVYAYVKSVQRLREEAEFMCNYCSSYFTQACHLKRHWQTCPEREHALHEKRKSLARERNCSEDSVILTSEEVRSVEVEDLSNRPLEPVIQHIYATGRYRPPKRMIDRLKFVGIDLTNVSLTYPYFIIFDCESLLKKADGAVNWETVTSAFIFEKVHECCCVGMTSNVPNYDIPRAFIACKEKPEGFMEEFIQFLLTIATTAESHYRDQIQPIFRQIKSIKESCKGGRDPLMYKMICSLEKRLDEFCQQIPVVGWNSSR